MSHAHPDVPATRIPLSQITDHARNPTGTAPMEHPRKTMETVMEPFSPGRILTKNTADRNTLQDKRMNNLLMRTNRQIEPSTAYNRYPRTKASSSSSNQHTQTWIANQLYCNTPPSQLERSTSTCTHSSATDWLHIMVSKKNIAKNCTTTSRHSTSIAKASSKTKSIKKTMTHTMDPMTINKSSMMTTLTLTMSKSVLQHAANVTAALSPGMHYTSTFKKHAWYQNLAKAKNQSHLG